MAKKKTSLPQLTADDIKVNRVYRAKKPKMVGNAIFSYVNDRQVIWLGGDSVQYDSPSVKNGRHYPRLTMKEFLQWVGEDVTEKMPKDGNWATSL